MSKTQTKYTILTKEGFKQFNGFKNKKSNGIKFKFTNTDVSITTTIDHIFFQDDAEHQKLANELEVGDWLSHTDFGYLCIESIESIEDINVYDALEVKSSNHSYITEGFNSHNCSFIGSSSTLIPGEYLQELNNIMIDPIEYKHEHKLFIYENPEPNSEYVIGVDPAEGVEKDHSVAQVFKIVTADNQVEGEHYTLIQVATFRDNKTKPRAFSQLVIGIADFYNKAWLMVENNNACGGLVTNFIWNDYEYENMINPDKGKNGKLGITATKPAKYKANMKLQEMILNYQIKIVDKMTIEELNSYEEIKPNIYAAGNSSVHDDTVTAMNWAITFLENKYYSGYGENLGQAISEDYKIDSEYVPAFRNPNNKQNNIPANLKSMYF
jgi:hypothetical protein